MFIHLSVCESINTRKLRQTMNDELFVVCVHCLQTSPMLEKMDNIEGFSPIEIEIIFLIVHVFHKHEQWENPT